MSAEEQKSRAALGAIDYVEDGMRLGLGTGSTAVYFVDAVGERVAQGLNVVCVPTSEATAAQARGLNIHLTTLEETPELDLTVDGADELDGELNLIKGGGGALLREKIVATASARMLVIADASKKVAALGQFKLPVEVVPFGAQVTYRRMVEVARAFGCQGEVTLRTNDNKPFITDGQHFIYDCAFGRIEDPAGLADELNRIPGVVENGLFISIATLALIGTDEGVDTVMPASN
jgi:ribose 5-phosphate isomerase A